VLDAAWSTLLDDLRHRGLLQDTLVVWMGEFGRTPRINNNAGRDHSANGWSAVLVGGGRRAGQLIGRTSADGMTIEERPVSAADFLATICLALASGSDQTESFQHWSAHTVGGTQRPADSGGFAMTRLRTHCRQPLALPAVLLLGTMLLLAQEKELTTDSADQRDQVAAFLLTSERPILLGLRVTLDDQPLASHWRGQVEGLFRFVDRDGDNRLDRQEKERLWFIPFIPSVLFLLTTTPMGSSPSTSFANGYGNLTWALEKGRFYAQ